MLHRYLQIAALAPTAPEGGGGIDTSLHTPGPPAEVIFNLFGVLPVTNSILTTWLVMLVLVLLARASTRKMSQVPRGAQNLWELVIETWDKQITDRMGKRGRRFLPVVVTGFLFILFSNWIGILPIVGNILVLDPTGHSVPLFRSANSDLNITAAMAIIMILLAEVFEFRSLGPLGYLKGLAIPNPLRWLEIITRPLSLSFRLFGNIFAGEVLVVTMLGIAPFALFVFLGLEIFVGFIQALIFSMLALVFFSIATAHEHGHEATHEGEHATGTGSASDHGHSAQPGPVAVHVAATTLPAAGAPAAAH